MTTVQEEKIARRKLSLLQLAQELGNVSRACKIVGYSRQQFYEVRRNFQLYGAEGLIDQLPGPRGPHPNRVGEEVEAAILEHSLACPTQGARAMSLERADDGMSETAEELERAKLTEMAGDLGSARELPRSGAESQIR